jgi:hypothetical protein
MKKLINFLICVSLLLFATCFAFRSTSAKSSVEDKPKTRIENKKPEKHPNISMQQREIKDGLIRIEKKLGKRKKR